MNVRRWIRNWLNNEPEEVVREKTLGYANQAKLMPVEVDPVQGDSTVRFEVIKASGGYVVSSRVYDRRTDRNNNTLHIIRDDEDFNEALGKIVTMESMKL